MHPALIPDRHPMCGKYMEALVACRDANPYHKFFGACNEHTFDLSKCLKEEKKARYHEKWAAKRAVDEQRMAEIREQQAQQEGEAPSEQQD